MAVSFRWSDSYVHNALLSNGGESCHEPSIEAKNTSRKPTQTVILWRYVFLLRYEMSKAP
jgi:hypothetical protein